MIKRSVQSSDNANANLIFARHQPSLCVYFYLHSETYSVPGALHELVFFISGNMLALSCLSRL